MRCPRCGDDFRPGVTRCPDCDVWLVEPAPDATGDRDATELVSVFETSDPSLFPVVASLLEAEGIPVVVQGESAVELFPVRFSGLFKEMIPLAARLLVPADRAAEARALVESRSWRWGDGEQLDEETEGRWEGEPEEPPHGEG